MVELSGGVKNTIKYNEEIKNLFEGYPNFYINEILERYVVKKYRVSYHNVLHLNMAI